MSNCVINTRKFKQFSLYDYNNPNYLGNCMGSPFGHGNGIQENDVFLVGYQYRVSSCPEIKMKLSDIIDLAQDDMEPISLDFRLAVDRTLQFTTNADAEPLISWTNTNIKIPSESDLRLEVRGTQLYYTLDGTTGLNNPNCLFVQLPLSSGGTSTFTSTVDYDADPNDGPTAAFNNNGVFEIHLEQYPTVTGITGVGDLRLISNGGQWNNASGATNIYTFYDTDGTAFNQTIQVQNGEDGDPGEVPTFEIKNDGHLWATYLDGSSNDLGEVQITNISGGTYGIMNVKDVSLCDAAGDAYIDWNISSSTYGHLFYYTDVPSNSGTPNNPNPQDLGKIVGSDGVGIDSVVSQGSVTHTSGGHNTYVVKGTNNNTLGTFDVYDGINGASIGAVYCVDNNATLPNNTTLSNEVIPSSDGGRINKYRIIDTNHNTLNDIYIANGVDGTNGDTISVSGNTFTVQHSDGSPDSVVTVHDGADGTKVSLHKLVFTITGSVLDSNSGLYQLTFGQSGMQHFTYNTATHAFNTTPSAFDTISGVDYVELCPSDTNITRLATNLKYGIFGVYNNNNSAITLYAIKDPYADNITQVELILKAHVNVW